MPAALINGADRLSQVPLFAGLDLDERTELAGRLRRRRYRKDEILFLRGDPGTFLYLLESGRVKIALTSTEGKEMVLALLGAGDFFGELALIDGQPRSADALVMEASELLLLARADWLRFVEARPPVALHVMTVLSQRLRQTDELIHEAAFFDVPGRLASTLLRLADSIGQQVGEGVTLGRRLTQVELAEMIGASRESVNKWLGFYERQGLVRNTRGLITVLRPDGLRQRAY